MPELTTDFQSLPQEYLQVINLAQDRYNLAITPLQLLVGGWSGAVVYLVSVLSNESRQVEHCILKLDRKALSARSDEVTRHNTVLDRSTPEFARKHIAELAFERVEHEGAIAIFYRIAGQSLLNYLPLSRYDQQDQLKAIFRATHTVLLPEWNASAAFDQALHPQQVLRKWLGFRLDSGANIEQFLRDVCRVNPDTAGLLVNGQVFPNPMVYARDPEPWGKTRPIDIAAGLIHGDLNTNNILVKFSDNHEVLEGYYLIDFALFKEGMPLLYDQRYLEMSYLVHAMSRGSFARMVNLIAQMAEADVPDPRQAPIELSGVSAVIAEGRNAFGAWVDEAHPSLHDDLWGQYWLAGVAAGLSYTHKAGQPDLPRLAGLVYAAASLKRFAAVFNLPQPSEVELLYAEDRSDVDSPTPPLGRKPRHNLPVQPTPFIGRAAQVSAIKALLLGPDTRLVTLTGPGGTGKTRLSLQAAQEVLDQFPHGVYFVPLADDTDAGQFISRVAQHLKVREGGRDLLESVKDYLRDKRLLLVLDNFEQLLPAAPLVAGLLAAAPEIRIITSSRIVLNLHGERAFPVPPLSLPQAEGGSLLEDLADNESVLLFTTRVQAAQPGFTLTAENASLVAQICRLLDGLPLAIELAAARVKLLQPEAILARLDDRFKLLTGGARDLPARQQTLRNTLEWSYDLLNQDEKTLYARLGVFVGGFTLEAAEVVCNPQENLDMLEVLASLMDHSLIRQDVTADGEPRFGMLETIRAFALERLEESGEMETLRGQHAGYFGDIVIQRIGFELYTKNALKWLNWLEREHDNIRATLAWSIGTAGESQLATGLVFALIWFWYRRGYFIEGLAWAERLLASPELRAPSALRAVALQSYGILAIWKGEQDKGLSALEEGLPLLQGAEDAQWMAPALISNAVALINMGRDSAARPMLEHARVIFQDMKQPYFLAITLVHLGNVELGLGHPEQAQSVLEEAESVARTLDENWILSFALNNLGEVARTQGKYDLARKYYEECQFLLRDTGDRGDMARFVHSLGYIAQHEEEFELAESQFRKGLSLFRRLGNRRGIAECLAGLAGLKARQGQPAWGASLLGAAESLLQSTGGAWWPADRVEVEQNRAIMRSTLSEDEFSSAWQAGGGMTIDEAITFAADEP